jgi:hypothetical protein
MNKHFQNILNVSKAQSGRVQTSGFRRVFCFMGLPGRWLDSPHRLTAGILVGLVVRPSRVPVHSRRAVFGRPACLLRAVQFFPRGWHH